VAINFPNSPSNGATHTVGNITYVYDSSKGVWKDSPAGLAQSIDALTDVDISTAAPTNGQILEYNSSSGKFVPADSSAGVTVYATIDDLPLTGVTEGSMALVDSTDKLYIFSDTGWYSIALVNTSPSISGVNASYTLATNGSATTVTVTASDPEGIPITYSIVSDTSGNVATVAQGTGSNTNQWTITPSTNTAHAGSFTLVFRASDGTNVASASSTFTLVFSIENSSYTTALITSVGANNAVNNSFVDSSSNSHTITANGNVTQGTFSPYRHGGYSTYLGTATSYLRTPTDARYDIGGTGDWSYEAWVYVPTSHTFASYARAFGMGPFYNDSKSFGVILSDSASSAKMTVYWHDGSIGRKLTSTTAFDKGKWNHIAVCRTGNDIALYYNGTRIAHNSSYTASISTGNTYLFSGGTGNDTEGFNGYIRDVHFVNGSHDYDASSASLTVPTEKISAISNTKYLGSQEPYINDNSTHDVAITTNGTVITEPFSPYDHGGYSTSVNGGSMYFDGTGDYLTAGTDASLALGSGDFTFECWIYPPTATMANYAGIYSNTSDGAGDSNALRFGNLGTDATTLAVQTAASSIFNSTSGAVKVGQWNHVALVRSGTSTNNMTIYVNGLASGSGTSTANFSTGYATIGTNVYSGVHYLYSGYMANVRVVSGTAVYTSAFTPPTAPLTAITNTSLLLPFDDAGIIDKSQSVKTITLNGDVKSSTTQTKFLTSSMYFDGTGDYLQIDNENVGDFGTADFTAEGWFYLTASPANYIAICETRGAGASTTGWAIAINAAGSFYVYSGAFLCQAANSSISSNTWYHWAYSRESGNHKLFLNGTQVGSTSTTSRDYTDTNFRIGANFSGAEPFTGYQSDVRITKGLARYTSNFTAPTAAIEG